ncbi:choice-of-anchor J domain-containing protein [Nocardioides baculatus]|uniref:Choice-of-anchor J domain-containing protein n=1 Tax=Nocardioides baculatus TaxID=2801337 RepID=A0ABS1LAZ7_9ACTN|nr:choice-of-anchor J domain-containing protein [Nocardioides baculatus]MBL0747711.1 choice-of-anchor J domain-containing protein [Nocardioides baculatus]
MFRRTSRLAVFGLVAGALAVTTTTPAQAASYTEGFDNVAALTSWKVVNLSNPDQPVAATSWQQGDPANFPAQSGAENSYIGVSYEAGFPDASAWLISPQQTSLSSTDALNFWTRVEGSTYPDRIEVRMSTNGSCNPGTTTDGVGDFTTLLGAINPDQVVNGYPTVWTQYNLPLTGLSTTNVSGCVAFRYYVKDTQRNGLYVGIDSVAFTDNASTACTTAQASATSAQATVTSATSTLTAANQTVTTAKKVLKKAKKKLKKARKADAPEKKIKKLKKKVKKAKKALKRARAKAATATTALTNAQAALAAAQASTTSSCP